MIYKMKNYNNLCMNCMEDISGNIICPHCGHDQRVEVDDGRIKPRTLLQEKYLVGEKVDQNGEGIGYIGYDIYQNSIIYIKEFFPQNLCQRSEDGINVTIQSKVQSYFDKYKDEFLLTARSFAKLKELSVIVSAYDIFKEGNTAYYVCEWINGINLIEYINKQGGYITWQDARPLFMPLLSTLGSLHKYGILHLGINPENLIITFDNKIKLIGFSMKSIRKKNSVLSPELYSGYSAIEQYVLNKPISEKTDIYSFAACLFFAISGEAPNNAMQRKKDAQLLISENIIKNTPKNIIKALAHSLKIDPDDRPSSFEELRLELSPVIINKPEEDNMKTDNGQTLDKSFSKTENKEDTENNKKLIWIAIPCIIAILALIAFGFFWMYKNANKNINQSLDSNSSEIVSSDSSTNSSETTKASNQIVVPNIIGVDFKEAQRIANDQKLYELIQSGESFSDSAPAGVIISQSPPSGEQVKKGSVIDVEVSKGPKMRTLPAISNLSLSEASDKIASIGLIPIKVESESDKVGKGFIIGYKDNKPGDKVEYGKQVGIVVSKGPKV